MQTGVRHKKVSDTFYFGKKVSDTFNFTFNFRSGCGFNLLILGFVLLLRRLA